MNVRVGVSIVEAERVQSVTLVVVEMEKVTEYAPIADLAHVPEHSQLRYKYTVLAIE